MVHSLASPALDDPSALPRKIIEGPHIFASRRPARATSRPPAERNNTGEARETNVLPSSPPLDAVES